MLLSLLILVFSLLVYLGFTPPRSIGLLKLRIICDRNDCRHCSLYLLTSFSKLLLGETKVRLHGSPSALLKLATVGLDRHAVYCNV